MGGPWRLSQQVKAEKDKYHMISLKCGRLKKNKKTQINYLQNRFRHKKGTYAAKGKGGGGIDQDFGIDMYTLFHKNR